MDTKKIDLTLEERMLIYSALTLRKQSYENDLSFYKMVYSDEISKDNIILNKCNRLVDDMNLCRLNISIIRDLLDKIRD